MKIRRLSFENWLHFDRVEMVIPDDARVICLVGANGTGKTLILELIARYLPKLTCPTRPREPKAPDKLELEVHVPHGISQALDQADGQRFYRDWDRTIIFGHDWTIGGINHQEHIGWVRDFADFRNDLHKQLRDDVDVQCIFLDATRTYPKRQFSTSEIYAARDEEWLDHHLRHSTSSWPELHSHWLRYLLGQHYQAWNAHLKMAELKNANKEAIPTFRDPFEDYRKALTQIMPHICLDGIDDRFVWFSSNGVRLQFDDLSAGEREISFLVGQFDRFKLKHGILLIDEPELHLNPDLIRTWVRFLARTMETGQVWLATHSLEVAEACGEQATFVLERNDQGKVLAAPLTKRPLLSTLSRAVGSPAFSIERFRFVCIEGEEGIGERERFDRLCGTAGKTLFLNCGGCGEVVRRTNVIKALASESEQPIRIGGVIDRDWRSIAEVSDLHQSGFFVLPVHEVENFFLHPATLQHVLKQQSRNTECAQTLVCEAADARAGLWVYAYAWALYSKKNPRIQDIQAAEKAAKGTAFQLSWSMIENDISAVMKRIAEAARTQDLLKILVTCAKIYKRKRTTDELWRCCEGKEIFHSIAKSLGFTNPKIAEGTIFAAWDSNPELVPEELTALRKYVRSL